MGQGSSAVKAPQGVKTPQGVKAPHAVKAPLGASKTPQGPACNDFPNVIAKDPTGKELWCKDLSIHCNDAQNGATIRQHCPRSCGLCPIDAQAPAPQGVQAPKPVKAPQAVKAPKAVKSPQNTLV